MHAHPPNLLLALTLVLALPGFAATAAGRSAHARPSRDATPAGPVTLERLRTARLECPRTATRLCLGGVTLHDGAGTTDEGVQVSLLEERVSVGDFDGDTTSDAAVVLSCWPGGPRVHNILAVVSAAGGTIVCRAAEDLGAGIGVHFVSLRRSEVQVDLTTRGEDDPPACPSHRRTRVYRLAGGRLAGRDATPAIRVSQALCPAS